MTVSQQQDTSSSASTGQDQNDGDAPDSSDKPPHESTKKNGIPATTSGKSTDTNGSARSIPLPPPEAGTYEKQPGHTFSSLKKVVMSASPHNGISANGQHEKDLSDSSYPPSPTGAASDWDESAPSSPRHSRAPSFTANGSKPFPKQSSSTSAPNTPAIPHQTPSATKEKKRSLSRSSIGNISIPIIFKGASTPSTPAPSAAEKTSYGYPPDTPSTGATDATVKAKKPASVHSNDGKESHKFNLKDLLASGPKLSRKSSQRSTASSRKSDTDHESAQGRNYPYSSGPKSTAGESTTSLTQKYGVCQKVAIGKGATSVVRLAHKWDRTEEKLYAVKEFRKRRKNESEKDYVKKLTAEFCISSTLHHVNVVETVDLIQDENHKWCEVMEYCPGGDLYAAIKKGGMSPSEVECCFKQILSGVQYLHNQGVAHRDIKPENLFFDTKGHLKIGDYGASTVYRLPWETTVHMSTGLCGSEPYIAPEQFLGKPYDARLVDIWACGIVYYCLHFQELPWRVAQLSDQLYASYAQACGSSNAATSSCPPTINNLSPRACRPVIRRILEPDPQKRADIEEIIKHSWIQQIEVCHVVEQPRHVHVHAQSLAQAQMREWNN